MKPETIVNKMREYVQDFRGQLAKGDLSSVPTLTENSGTFFRELMQELPEGTVMGREVRVFANCVDRFGTACEQQDMETAAQTLAEMEAVTEAARQQCGIK